MQEDTMWSNVFKAQDKEEKSIYSVLKQVPIFRDLNHREIKALEKILHRRTYKENEVIFSEDEPGAGMYIIEKGKVFIKAGKDEKVLAALSTGDFFGEMALLLESPRTATAVAKSSLKMLGFFQPDLFHLLETKPRTGNKILQRLAQMIAERLRQTTIENQEIKIKITELEAKLQG